VGIPKGSLSTLTPQKWSGIAVIRFCSSWSLSCCGYMSLSLSIASGEGRILGGKWSTWQWLHAAERSLGTYEILKRVPRVSDTMTVDFKVPSGDHYGGVRVTA
jgi:hypothetical protein